VDLRPLYERSRALSTVNAPRAPARHRLGARASRALPGVRKRRRSDAHTFADATTTGEPLAVTGDRPKRHSFGLRTVVSLAARLDRRANGVGRARRVSVAGARSDAVARGARSRAGA
jgi:hypothetical protein